jgi:peroxiredoxin
MDQVITISFVFLWVIVLLNLLLTLALIRRVNSINNNSTPQQMDEMELFDSSLPLGADAPYFEAESLSGGKISLSDFAGQELVMVFISPNCGPCREGLPGWEELSPGAARSGTALVLVSLDGKEATEELAKEFNLTLPILAAPRGINPLADDYKVMRTPSYYLINAQGRVTYVGIPNPVWNRWKSLTKSWAGEVSSVTN